MMLKLTSTTSLKEELKLSSINLSSSISDLILLPHVKKEFTESFSLPPLKFFNLKWMLLEELPMITMLNPKEITENYKPKDQELSSITKTLKPTALECSNSLSIPELLNPSKKLSNKKMDSSLPIKKL
jgi:hypothetical protein